MSRLVRAGAVAAFAALAAFAPDGTTLAEVRSCVTTVGTASCQFSCTANGTVTIEVYGAKSVQGVASCRTDSARCTGTSYCTDSDSLGSPEGQGYCDLTTGVLAICSSS